MTTDSDTIVGICSIVAISLALFFIGYQTGKWVQSDGSGTSTKQTQDVASSDAAKSQEIHPSAKKESNTGNTKDDDGLNSDQVPMQHLDEKSENQENTIIDAIVTRLLEKVERGEITLQCACGMAGSQESCESDGGKNITYVTRVTHVTRLEYRCLLGDDIRWAMMETNLREVLSEETRAKMARTQEETRAATEDLKHELERQLSKATKHTEEHLEELTTLAKVEQGKKMAEMERRLQELDSRLALEPQVMEVRGFMKIDTFGPVLLGMGGMQILLLLCASLLFLRPR